MPQKDAEILSTLSQHKVAVVLAVTAVWMLYKVIWTMYLSPTADIPGSLLDKLTSVRVLIATMQGRKMYFAQSQMQRYGPLVEIAPNVLACSDPAAIKTIYGSHDWRKSSFYSDFADIDSVPSLFSETRPNRSQLLRKAFLPAFSKANLKAMSGRIFTHLNDFLLKLDELEMKGEAVDAYRYFRYLTFEVVTDIGFGGEYDMISYGEQDHPFVRDFDDAVSFGVLNVAMGRLLALIPRSLWPESLRHWAGAPDRTMVYASDALEKWRTEHAAGKTGYRVDILQRLIDHGVRAPEEALTEQELKIEIMEIMLAGGDTTANTVLYACYELTRFPDVQAKLRKALEKALPDGAEATLEALERCEYLEWTIKEMTRMHPTLPSMLERVVPPAGAHIAGYTLRHGTIVAMSAMIQHSQSDVFARPDVFEPERWANETEAMRLNSLAFSTGPRSCVGQNLALVQMKIHTGVIFRHFRVSAALGTTPETMHPADFFQGKPKAGKCLLYFERVKI